MCQQLCVHICSAGGCAGCKACPCSRLRANRCINGNLLKPQPHGNTVSSPARCSLQLVVRIQPFVHKRLHEANGLTRIICRSAKTGLRFSFRPAGLLMGARSLNGEQHPRDHRLHARKGQKVSSTKWQKQTHEVSLCWGAACKAGGDLGRAFADRHRLACTLRVQPLGQSLVLASQPA